MKMSILPSELYEIIIGYIPIPCYTRMRLTCKDWWKFVEKSDYSEVLRFIRVISNTPEWSMDKDNACIADDGKIIKYQKFQHPFNAEFINIEHKYMYHNQHLYDIYRQHIIHEITNTYGDFKLCRTYMKVNDTRVLHFGGIASHIIQADEKIIIATLLGIFQYTGHHWEQISEFDSNLHVKKNISYRKHENTITLIKDNIELGIIKLLTSDFAFGSTYFVMKMDKLYFWHYE